MFCTMNIASAEKNVVVSGFIGKEYFAKINSLAQVGEVVQRVYMCSLTCLM